MYFKICIMFFGVNYGGGERDLRNRCFTVWNFWSKDQEFHAVSSGQCHPQEPTIRWIGCALLAFKESCYFLWYIMNRKKIIGNSGAGLAKHLFYHAKKNMDICYIFFFTLVITKTDIGIKWHKIGHKIVVFIEKCIYFSVLILQY